MLKSFLLNLLKVVHYSFDIFNSSSSLLSLFGSLILLIYFIFFFLIYFLVYLHSSTEDG